MQEKTIDITTSDGVMDTFICHPDEGGPFAPVLFYMDAPGIREELRDMVRRIATCGYFVMMPNMYYREARDYAINPWEKEERKKMWGWMNSLTNAKVLVDTAAMLEHLAKEAAAKPGAVGVVGYCMSGQFVLSAAATHPDRIKAMASYYGVKMATDEPDSPHLIADKATAEMYFAAAEIDEFAPQEMLDKLEARLKEVGANYRLEHYPGTHHGFAFPQRGDLYDKPAAERHWERMLSLFRRNLG